MTVGGFSEHSVPGGAVTVRCDRLSSFPDLAHGFSTRLGGVSRESFESLNLSFGRGDEDRAVEENFARFALSAGLSVNAYAFTNQVHGDLVRAVGAGDRALAEPGQTWPECDGLVTGEEGVPLLGKNADCVPILMYCPRPRVCAFVHGGWRGTAAAIAKKAVGAMAALGADPGSIIAAVGPAISPCCFLTHSDVTDALLPLGEEILEGRVLPTADGRSSVDLKGINAALLESAGVGEVWVCPDCTCCLENKYYSHRRTGAARGSMAAVIELLPSGRAEE